MKKYGPILFQCFNVAVNLAFLSVMTYAAFTAAKAFVSISVTLQQAYALLEPIFHIAQ
jgi:hypothetical protein